MGQVPGVDNATQAFEVVIVLGLLVFVLSVLVFSCLRKRLKIIYTPRILLLENKVVFSGKQSRSLFSWMGPVLYARDDDVLKTAGIDALVYLRFLRLMLRFALVTMPYGMVVLVPLNFHGGNEIEDGMDRISMSNVASSSPKLWGHFLAIWMYSLVIMMLTFREWKAYIEYRQAYMRIVLARHYVLLVKNLPGNMIQEQEFKQYLESIFPSKISRVYVNENLSAWDAKIQLHDGLVKQWERAKLHLEISGERPGHRIEVCCGPKQDSISFYENQLKDLQVELQAEQLAKHERLRNAFVVFKSLRSRSIALQSALSGQPFHYEVEEAPAPTEILWRNLQMQEWMRVVRTVAAYTLVVILLLFWTVPTTATSSLASITGLAEKFPPLKSFLDSLPRSVYGFIQGVLPVLLLNLFQLLLPIILEAIGKFQGLISRSKIATMVFVNLFVFQTVNTFFVFIISGSVWDSLNQILTNPTEIPVLLAESIPNQSNFFINYIALQVFAGHSLELIRLVPLLWVGFRLKFLAKTPREKAEAWKPLRVEYEFFYSKALLVFLVGLSYSVLAPLIVPFIVLYFAFGYVVWMNQILNVYVPEFDHGGTFWPKVFNRIMVATVVFQLLMVGVLFLKNMYTAPSLLVLLLIATIIYWVFIQKKFSRLSEHLALSECDASDADSQFLRDIENSYIRNRSVPGVQELSTDHLVPFTVYPDAFVPSVGGMVEEAEQDVGENSSLLSSTRGLDRFR